MKFTGKTAASVEFSIEMHSNVSNDAFNCLAFAGETAARVRDYGAGTSKMNASSIKFEYLCIERGKKRETSGPTV